MSAAGSIAAFDLVVLAELNPDVVVATDDDVVFGQAEQLVDRASLTLGSSGAITASAAVAQGLRVAICGVVGTDPVGDLTVDLLQARGIDTSAVIRAEAATGMTIVVSRSDGDRALLTFAGTMSALAARDVPSAVVDSARHVHASSYYLQSALQPGLRALFAGVRTRGGTTSLDPGWDPSQRWTSVWNVLPEVDVFLPNGQECVHIGGDPHVLTAARRLSGDRTVAVKLGADGAAVFAAGESYLAHVDPVPPVDTTGAGDNFDAGFIAAVLDGAAPDDALRRAVSSGTISVGGWGGTGRHASRAEAMSGTARIERCDEIEVTK